MRKKLLLLTPALLGMLLAGCTTTNTSGGGGGGEGSTPAPTSETSSEGQPSSEGSSSEEEPQKQDFTGVAFADLSVVYDGSEHVLGEVTGAPAGTTITYTGRTAHTDAGTYPATAKLSKDGYNDKTLTATLTISKGTLTGIVFEDGEFEYDGNPHSISITGTIPSSASVTYTSDVSNVTNTATDIGVYNVTATISDGNFNTLNLNAKLTIKVNDDERYLKWSDDTLFFQNALDDNYLYAYNSTDENLLRVSKDNSVDIVAYGDDTAMFVSKSTLSSAIKTANYDSSLTKTTVSNILSTKARYVQAVGNNVYYVINGLTQARSGIYKADLSGEEPAITCLSVGKASYLTLVNNVLYFADGNNGDKLSSISITGTNQTRTVVVDEKINNLYTYEGALYYTVNKLLGDYIEKYVPGTGRRKLTSDAGIDMCLIDGYLYYINIDKLTSAIWGEGIYKVNASPLVDNNLPGTLVIEKNDGICSLTSDGSYLYYYDMNGYKLIKAETDGTFVKDILDGFVKPADPTPTSLGGDLEIYSGKLYYLDIWDDKTLHVYNPQTSSNVRLTSSKVDNFTIVGDNLYMNMVSNVISNDIYAFNLKTGGDTELINSNDGSDFIIHDGYLYYAQNNSVGAKTAIRRTNLNTLEDEEVYNKGVSNLRVVNNKLCFLDGYKVYTMDFSNPSEITEVKPNGSSIHTTVFDTDGTSIYYREMYSVGYVNKRVSRYNVVTGAYTAMATDSTDPFTIVYHDGYVYYYNDTASASNNGLYRISADSTSTEQGTCVLACESTYYATTFTILGNNIYFLNYKTGGLFGDSHIYKVPVSGGEPIKVA